MSEQKQPLIPNSDLAKLRNALVDLVENQDENQTAKKADKVEEKFKRFFESPMAGTKETPQQLSLTLIQLKAVKRLRAAWVAMLTETPETKYELMEELDAANTDALLKLDPSISEEILDKLSIHGSARRALGDKGDAAQTQMDKV